MYYFILNIPIIAYIYFFIFYAYHNTGVICSTKKLPMARLSYCGVLPYNTTEYGDSPRAVLTSFLELLGASDLFGHLQWDVINRKT
ncbi:hypothetical protein CI610_03742 [invertebrate metagenome]|uniref:Uncharacterized protein n=1 Tax=invertebrate metagenome TaxID=1711999 RepID=A0A2H9T295_9ZZZZ